MESLQRFNLLLRFLVLVLTWFGLACFSSTKTIRDSNQNSAAQVVFFPVQPVKERSCHESNQTKHEWVWAGKTDVIYICPIGLYGETLEARCFCLCDAASVPSETESANTDNHAGADDKSPCCGPLWWVLLFNKSIPKTVKMLPLFKVSSYFISPSQKITKSKFRLVMGVVF